MRRSQSARSDFIHDCENSKVVLDELLHRSLSVAGNSVTFSDDFRTRLNPILEQLPRIKRVVLTGAWSSFNAAVAGKIFTNIYTKMHGEAITPNELWYLDTSDAMLVVISESGETGDTVAAVKTLYDTQQRTPEKIVPTLLLTNAEHSTLGKIVKDHGGAILLMGKGHDKNDTSTKGFVNELALLALLSVYIGCMGNLNETNENGASIIRCLLDPSHLMSEMEVFDDSKKRDDIRRFAEKVAELFLKSNQMPQAGQEVPPPNPALMLICPPHLVPILEEFRCKLIEHAKIAVDAHVSSDLKFGALQLLKPFNNIPAVILLDFDEMNEMDTIRYALSSAWPKDRDGIGDVPRKLFFIAISAQEPASLTGAGLPYISLKRGVNTLDQIVSTNVNSSPRLIEEYVLLTQLLWFFVYYFSKAIGRDPDEVDLLKTFKAPPNQSDFTKPLEIRNIPEGLTRSSAEGHKVSRGAVLDWLERKPHQEKKPN